ncbi:hypothetical protein [Lewinella sp. JB7]|uniref:hypothetical protein n=1 Tax=Lewinella sp. JB7 TaxID=2962887 RepID=UPI0020C9E064|nr:hypothetical protein [Lewinella sp. JB7]MCP9234844.1 hypothetical protein [Lewinella sp. JB7]
MNDSVPTSTIPTYDFSEASDDSLRRRVSASVGKIRDFSTCFTDRSNFGGKHDIPVVGLSPDLGLLLRSLTDV